MVNVLCKNFQWHAAENVSRCSGTVHEHALESGGDAVEETVSSSSSDFEAVQVNIVADAVAAESVQCV